MLTYKYGEFSDGQVAQTKKNMRKQIFFLLLIVDPATKSEYENIEVNKAFENIMQTFGGFNSLIGFPPEFVNVMSLLEAALIEYNSPAFSTDDFQHCMYRKLILDAGSEVQKIKEV